MSENAQERWGRQIANDELKPELLPERNAPWSELVFFAGTLNGYEVAGESPIELLAFADPITQRWCRRGELPNDLTALRVALFAEQAEITSAIAPLTRRPTMRYIHALVEAIRLQVVGPDDEASPPK